MTIIAGWTDGETAVIGGDSGAFDDGTAITVANPKVWRAGGNLVGVSGSFRIMEIVQRSELGDPYKVRDLLIAASERSGFPPVLDWGVLVVGLDGIYEIGSDFSVLKSTERYNAIGSGGSVALAAFHVLEHDEELSTTARMRLVLAASAYHTAYVRKPLKVISL